MWYLLTFVGGLVLGLGFLFWALRERKARQKAQKLADERALEIAQSELRLREVLSGLAKVEEDKRKRAGEVRQLREVIEDLVNKLETCRDPKVVRQWLTQELTKKLRGPV